MSDFIVKLLEMAVSQGIWAVLYIYLFLRMLNENKAREDRYQETIKDLSMHIYRDVERIEMELDDVCHIQENTENQE